MSDRAHEIRSTLELQWWLFTLAVPAYLAAAWWMKPSSEGFTEWFFGISLAFTQDSLGLIIAGVMLLEIVVVVFLAEPLFGKHRDRESPKPENIQNYLIIKFAFWESLVIYGFVFWFLTELPAEQEPQSLMVFGAMLSLTGFIWMRLIDIPREFKRVDS